MDAVRVLPERNSTNAVSNKEVDKFPLSHSEVVQLVEYGLEKGKYKWAMN